MVYKLCMFSGALLVARFKQWWFFSGFLDLAIIDAPFLPDRRNVQSGKEACWRLGISSMLGKVRILPEFICAGAGDEFPLPRRHIRGVGISALMYQEPRHTALGSCSRVSDPS